MNARDAEAESLVRADEEVAALRAVALRATARVEEEAQVANAAIDAHSAAQAVAATAWAAYLDAADRATRAARELGI